MILTISGASGVGKTTIISRLIEETPDSGYLRSTTTRAPRPKDAPGEYEFVSDETFVRLADRGAFAWETGVTGKHYGTRVEFIHAALRQNTVCFAALDLSGVRSLQEAARKYGLASAVRSVYILSPPAALLRERMRSRGEDDAQIESRLAFCASWDSEAIHTVDINLSFMRDHDRLEEKLDFVRNRLWKRT